MRRSARSLLRARVWAWAIARNSRILGQQPVGPAEPVPAYWMEPALTERVILSATNDTGAALHDHRLVATLPDGVTPNAASLHAVEVTALDGIDHPYSWRYTRTGSINHLPTLPASLSGQQIAVKALGVWAAGETRRFALYWSATGTPTPPTVTHLNTLGVVNQYYSVGRVGPDTATWDSNNDYRLGLPNTGHTAVASRLTLGRVNQNEFLALWTYRVNGDATQYKLASATQETVTVNPDSIVIAGTMTGETRSGQAGPDWNATYTATYQHRAFIGKKSDNTNAANVLKPVNVVRMQLTMTAAQQQTPPTLANSGNSSTNYLVFSLTDAGATYSGNATAAAEHQVPKWHVPSGGSLTATANSMDLSAQPIVGPIFGASGNTHAQAFTVHSASMTGFTAHPNAKLSWYVNGSGFPALQVMGLTSAQPIPAGAQIVVDFTYAFSVTRSATATGDVMLPTELAALMATLHAAPTVTVGSAETYAAGMASTLDLAGARAVEGVAWFQTNSATIAGRAGASGFQYNPQTGALLFADDDDSSYGEAHKLHGLCLRYRRTHDAALIPLIEAQVAYHLLCESVAVASYGDFWLGAAPYGFWPNPEPSGSRYQTEGQMEGTVDPAFGVAPGPVSYTQGQVRRKSSVDQMHMVAHGMFAYLYLLRDEAAITANTTLRADALAYVGRMATFEAATVAVQARTIANLYAVLQAASFTAGSYANGMTLLSSNTAQGSATMPDPYLGAGFKQWQVDNGDNLDSYLTSNLAIDDFFRAIWAPNTTQAGVLNYLRGRANDMLTLDLGYHEGTSLSAGKTYPEGWALRSGVAANKMRYTAGRAGDDHYLEVGYTDHFCPRGAQRAIVLGLAALQDPDYVIPVEMDGATVVRTMPIQQALDEALRVLALYGVEPTSGAMRWAMPGWTGVNGDFHPLTRDSAFTGYFLMATELWYLVQQRVAGTFDPADYYRFAGVA